MPPARIRVTDDLAAVDLFARAGRFARRCRLYRSPPTAARSRSAPPPPGPTALPRRVRRGRGRRGRRGSRATLRRCWPPCRAREMPSEQRKQETATYMCVQKCILHLRSLAQVPLSCTRRSTSKNASSLLTLVQWLADAQFHLCRGQDSFQLFNRSARKKQRRKPLHQFRAKER